MKLFMAALILFAITDVDAQTDKITDSPGANMHKNAYELKQYWFVMLVNGPNRNQDSAIAAKIQDGHMANINRLAGIGKLMVAGPFDIYIQ